ncbi:hypothetical protein [Legionella hackeliae]|uniref:Uncharacterized protein n=1 Tax=Legionella hackeliae TaxID=449 RepID=A0A0A8UVF8_LEGHA|nr:hypothetical protein [Legionella hackeliae]KTD06634.1 hypothetical protein Lhac_3157 [Legionella hackeliae]CEK10749.1 protein of unknown function [Legionella hackeliae]STX47492.1 Uncharacterised protein [Legionella hackeliae]
MPKILHSNENTTLDITKPLQHRDILLGRLARLIHRELLLELQRNNVRDTKPGSTAVIAVGDELFFATENHIEAKIIQKMKLSLVTKLNSHAREGKESVTRFINEQRDKLSGHTQSYSHEKVRQEFNDKWRYKKHYDGSSCTIDDVYKFFERTIIGVQDDIDCAVLALSIIEKDNWVLALLDQDNMTYIENSEIHGERVKSHNPHPEITLVSYVNKFYSQFKGQLPLLKNSKEEIPYLFVASGIKSCQKCHTLLSGNEKSKFDGFNGAYGTSRSPGFVVFLYDHYNSGYPRYWVPNSFHSITGKSSPQLQEILNNASIPSRKRERDDRIEFFFDRLIKEDYLMTDLQKDQIVIEAPGPDEIPHSAAPLKPQALTPFQKNLNESSIQFWSKLKPSVAYSSGKGATHGATNT